MKEVIEFLKKTKVYFLATADKEQPKVRPFGTINEFDGKLYIQTGKSKPVAKQIAANPKFSISAFDGDDWIRIEGILVEDDRVEARKSMLDAYPTLRGRYDENDGNTVVYYFKNAKATIESFTEAKKEFEF
jgi:uncharacterized pyridoxamine 5'-phosphate oxidase family protein